VHYATVRYQGRTTTDAITRITPPCEIAELGRCRLCAGLPRTRKGWEAELTVVVGCSAHGQSVVDELPLSIFH
jgi:hypothetical protein